MSVRRVVGRASAAVVVVSLLVLGTGLAASAHVTVQPGEAPKGSFSQLSFRVPNERDDASTTKVEIQIPIDHPMPYVSTKPLDGWTVTTETTKLDQPIEAEGGEITEVVSQVTWEGGEVKPGEYQDFSISAGPLPDDTDQLVFKAIQTYSDGEEVAWVQETPAGGEEPEHPAPVLTLTEATGDAHGGGEEAAEETGGDAGDAAKVAVTASAVSAAQDDADSATTLATIALAVGALGLIVGIVGVVLARKSTT